jgi:hypothetical protein
VASEPESRISDAVKGYRRLASELVTKWGELASDVAAKCDAEEYDSSAAMKAWARTTRLTAETGFLTWFEALDAIAILSGRQYSRYEAKDRFDSGLPGADLTVSTPLRLGQTYAVLVAEVVPAKLPDGETWFELHADGTGRPGGTYVGKVTASKPGAESRYVDVWLTVP